MLCLSIRCGARGLQKLPTSIGAEEGQDGYRQAFDRRVDTDKNSNR